MNLTKDQREAINKITKFFNQDKDTLFVLNGKAGTGKSEILKHIIEKELVSHCSYLAPTNKARNNVNNRLKEERVETIHSFLFYSHLGEDGKLYFKDRNNYNKNIIVDEYSMVGNSLLNKIKGSSSKVCLIGDNNQLPPVKDSTPSLKINYNLDKVIRSEDKIVQLSHSVINDKYFNSRKIPREYFVDDKKMIEICSRENLQILCYTNKTRIRTNKIVRKVLERKNDIEYGDKMITLFNLDFLPKSEVVKIEEVFAKGDSDVYRTTISFDGRCYGVRAFKQHLNALAYKDIREIRPRYGARGNDNFVGLDYAYCLTTHRFQGSEADEVLVMLEPSLEGKALYNRWLYTSITRAKKKIYFYKV